MTTDLGHFPLFIDGNAVESDRVLDIIDPSTGARAATAACATAEHVDAAVTAAQRSFEAGEWSRATPAERAAVLRRIADVVGERADELVELEATANGATVRQATGFHIGYVAPHLTYFAEQCEKYAWETPSSRASFPSLGYSVVRREPIGVVGAIAPWNFPLLLGLWKMAPALAAGNSVVMKPDEKTPLATLEFARIAHECGLPAGVLNVIPGIGYELGPQMCADPRIGKIGFTGSTAVGREIMRNSADSLKGVTLELGGKSPAIVLEDADLDITVDGLLWGCMLYSGQICMSMTRAIVPSSIHDEVVERLVERAATIKIGDPHDWDTDMGPVISQRQRDRILDYINQGTAAGAKLAMGGGIPKGAEFDSGYWIEPTIFTGVTNDMTIAREEIFGPVLSVIKYENEREALAIANDSDYGLAASVWSTDNERAIDVANKVQAGALWINDAHRINVEVPFGGFKQSGLGRELGPSAMDSYTEVKDVFLELTGRHDARPYDALLSHAD